MQYLIDTHFVIIATGHFKSIVRRTIFGQQGFRRFAARHLLLQFIQARLFGFDIGKDGQHFGKERVLAFGKGFHRFLAQITNARALRKVDAATRGHIQPGQDAQQGGLANAIGADQANFAIVLDASGETEKDIEVTVRLAQVRNG